VPLVPEDKTLPEETPMSAPTKQSPDTKPSKRRPTTEPVVVKPAPWWGALLLKPKTIRALALGIVTVVTVGGGGLIINHFNGQPSDRSAQPAWVGKGDQSSPAIDAQDREPSPPADYRPDAVTLSAENQNADGSMPATDATMRIHDARLDPDQYSLIGVRNVRDTENGTYLYPCGAVDQADVLCPNIVLGTSHRSKGPWTIMAIVVDAGGKAIIDGKHGKPFLDDPHQLLGHHLVRYGAIPLARKG
jgi:hypothetical protein